ncbi:hypothetical protein ACFVU4_32640 [Streptomyces sp. NPDC058107]|uniref:hypothetical protein n=1 Tax=Streptomyces sp. NPDC058107 TaxID=3346343 RepID=UPI0036E5BC70
MGLPDTDFAAIRGIGAGGRRDGFEQFVCELAAEDKPCAGARFVSLHGAGGDGGVECYWTLPDGTKHGWQAKYWVMSDAVDKAQLTSSVTAALNNHPELTRYVIAIATDPTGITGTPDPTVTGAKKKRGQSLLEKAADWVEEWEGLAKARNMIVSFEFEWATNLLNQLRNVDAASGVRTRYWFDATLLTDQWWHDRLDEATHAAGPRYVKQLALSVTATDALAALSDDPNWRSLLSRQVDILRRALEAFRSSPDTHDVLSAGDLLIEALDALRENPDVSTIAWIDAQQAELDRACGGLMKGMLPGGASMARGTLDGPEDAARDTEKFRQRHAAMRNLDEWQARWNELKPVWQQRATRVMLLSGEAGTGKTFVCLDFVASRLKEGRLGLLLHGSRFRQGGGTVLNQLAAQLELPAEVQGEDVLTLLDQAGRSAESTVVVAIDALNESAPRSLWRDELAAFVAKAARYPNLRIVLTLRSHYRPHVVPEGLGLSEFLHDGFGPQTADAVREYAEYYGLERPVGALVHQEFGNPLFLRLLCEALRGQRAASLDQAAIGITQLVDLLLDRANTDISHRLGAPPGDSIVHAAMAAIAQALSISSARRLDRITASSLTRSIWADATAEGSLLDALISEGLLAEDVDPSQTGHRRRGVRMAFERLGQHLIVIEALADLVTYQSIGTALQEGALRELLGLDDAPDMGLLEALATALAHRDGYELTCFSDQIDLDTARKAVVIGLPWRAGDSITEETKSILTDTLNDSATLDMLFRLAPNPDHPLNAEFLHQQLTGLPMGRRDALLIPFLEKSHRRLYGHNELRERARRGKLDDLGAATTRLWVTALLWCTGSTSRQVRDQATLGAARLLVRRPTLAPSILKAFLPVDDDWIVERACYVAYTALLRSGTREDWRAAAAELWEAFFAGTPPLSSALRDEGRSIIEAAAAREALPEGTDLQRARPPYASTWPIQWPSLEDVSKFDNHAKYPHLYGSCLDDDFHRYVITRRRLSGIEPDAAGRRVLTDAIELGYSPTLHADYDHHIIDKYGAGRARGGSFERIGKKYQWIALARLHGMLGDHTPTPTEPWDAPPAPIPGPQTNQMRQMDPTICDAYSYAPPPQPHVPSYDWPGVADTSDTAWIADDIDLPDVRLETSGHVPRLVVYGDYEWRSPGPVNSAKPVRSIWRTLTSRIVAVRDLEALLDELRGKDLFSGDLLAGGATYLTAFVGEYPFGHHADAESHVIAHETTQEFAVATRVPTRRIVGEYSTSPEPSPSLVMLGPEFFGPAPGALHWDGRHVWRDSRNMPVAFVRQVIAGGQNELRVDAAWLNRWLAERDETLVWLEGTGKDILRSRPGRDSPGRLLRSRVHYQTEDGRFTHLPPVFDRVPPRAADR